MQHQSRNRAPKTVSVHSWVSSSYQGMSAIPGLMLHEYRAVLTDLGQDTNLDIKVKLDNIKDLMNTTRFKAETQPQGEAEKPDEPMTSSLGISFRYLDRSKWGSNGQTPFERDYTGTPEAY